MNPGPIRPIVMATCSCADPRPLGGNQRPELAGFTDHKSGRQSLMILVNAGSAALRIKATVDLGHHHTIHFLERRLLRCGRKPRPRVQAAPRRKEVVVNPAPVTASSEPVRGGHGDRVACSHAGLRKGDQRAKVPGTGGRREQHAHHAHGPTTQGGSGARSWRAALGRRQSHSAGDYEQRHSVQDGGGGVRIVVTFGCGGKRGGGIPRGPRCSASETAAIVDGWIASRPFVGVTSPR